MRIMPHVLLSVAASDFQEIATSIVANGLITHGHPRALVGALAYGYAVWHAFRQHGTLQYGGLIELTLQGQQSWGALPVVDHISPTWYEAAQTASSEHYETVWRSTVDELLSLLERCRDAIKQGALAIDHETLNRIGCFDPKVNGAGTVTAAGAILLASRHAADPLHGILEAAFAPGADTDTLASMSGALLGAIHGYEWLAGYSDEIQDSKYCRSLADQITQARKLPDKQEATELVSIKKSDLDSVISKLTNSHEGVSIILPDSREAKVSARQRHVSSSTLEVFSWRLTTGDGQTLYVKRITRKPKERNGKNKDKVRTAYSTAQGNIQLVSSWVKLPVSDFEKSRLFFKDVIGLRVQAESANRVRFEGAIELVAKPYCYNLIASEKDCSENQSSWRTILLLETHAFEPAYQRVQTYGAKILTPLTEKSGRRFFRCLDPDENIVELVEAH